MAEFLTRLPAGFEPIEDAATFLTRLPAGFEPIIEADDAAVQARDRSVFDDPVQEVIELGKGIAPGAVRLAGTTLTGLGGVLRGNERDILDLLDAVDRGQFAKHRGNPNLGPLLRMAPEQRANLRAEIEESLSVPFTETSLARGGAAVSKFGRELLPAKPGFEESIGRQLGEGLGSVVAGVGLALLPGGQLAAPLAFTFAGSGEAVERAIQAGATEEQIIRAANLGTIPGVSDALPIEVLVGRVPLPGGKFLKVPAGMLGRALKSIGRIGWQAFVEGVQEGGQEFLQNLIAREVHTPETVLTEGIVPAAGLGAGVGAIADVGRQIITSAAGRRRRPIPPGEREKSGAVPAEPLSAADRASPIDDSIQEEGQALLRDAEATGTANDILRRNGLPAVGARVTVTREDGEVASGEVVDSFTETNAELGLEEDGIKIALDGGGVFEEFIGGLADRGVRIAPEVVIDPEPPVEAGEGAPLVREEAPAPPTPPPAAPAPAAPAAPAAPSPPVIEEIADDREEAGRVLRPEREGQEPGRPVPEPRGRREEAGAGRVLQKPGQVEGRPGIAPLEGPAPRAAEREVTGAEPIPDLTPPAEPAPGVPRIGRLVEEHGDLQIRVNPNGTFSVGSMRTGAWTSSQKPFDNFEDARALAKKFAAGDEETTEVIAQGRLKRLGEITAAFNKPRVSKARKAELIAEAKTHRRELARLGKSQDEIRAAEGLPPAPVTEQAQAKVEVSGASRLAAKRLRITAGKMEVRADESLSQDRLTNTVKRAREAAGAEASAAAEKAIAKTAARIADLIDAGEAGALSQVKNIADVRELESALQRAMREADKDLTFAEQEKRRGRPPEEADFQAASMPTVFIHGRLLDDILKVVRGTRGLGENLNLVRLIATGLGRERQRPITSEKEITALKAVATAAKKKGDKFDAVRILDQVRDRERLAKMGITTDADMQTALRAYVDARTVKAKADPIKEAERKLIGTKIPGFFQTPVALAERMVDEAEIGPGMAVLEPSAGAGRLVDAIATEVDRDTITIIEPMSTLREILEFKGYTVASADFMEHTGEYDRIVMNPPFEKGQDIDHVRRAYDLLKPGGKLVSIMSPGPFQREAKKDVAFREWFEEVGGTVEDLPAGTFKESGTGAGARLVVIEKAEGAPRAEPIPDLTPATPDLAAPAAAPTERVAEPAKPSEPTKTVGPTEAEQLDGYVPVGAAPQKGTDRGVVKIGGNLVESAGYVSDGHVLVVPEVLPKAAKAMRESGLEPKSADPENVRKVVKDGRAGKAVFEAKVAFDPLLTETGTAREPALVYGTVGDSWVALNAIYYDFARRNKLTIKGDPKKPDGPLGMYLGETFAGVVMPMRGNIEAAKVAAERVGTLEVPTGKAEKGRPRLGVPRTQAQLEAALNRHFRKEDADRRAARLTPEQREKRPELQKQAINRLKVLEDQAKEIKAERDATEEGNDKIIKKAQDAGGKAASAKKYANLSSDWIAFRNSFVDGWKGLKFVTSRARDAEPDSRDLGHAAGKEYAKANPPPKELGDLPQLDFELKTVTGQITKFKLTADPQIIADFSKRIGGPTNIGKFSLDRGPVNPRFAGDVKRIGANLQARLKKIGIAENVALRVVDELQAMIGGQATPIGGRFTPGELRPDVLGRLSMPGLIEVALRAQDDGSAAQWIIDHEAIHALRELGLFRDAEWTTLTKAAVADTERMGRMREQRQGQGLDQDQIVEEVIADMFADWSVGRTQAGGFLKRAFERIRDFLAALGRALTQRGYTSVNDIFGAVERGEVGRRDPVDETGPMAMSQAFMDESDSTKMPPAPKLSQGRSVSPPATFDNADTEAEYQDARKGAASQETLATRVGARLKQFGQGFTRHYIHLPNTAEFAEVGQAFRKFEAAPKASMEQIVRILRQITQGMGPNDLDLFTRKVVLDDLSFEADQEHALPFKMTPEDVAQELAKIDQVLANRPDLLAKLRQRKLVARGMANRLVEAGILHKEQIKNPAYYRHQILDYARATVAEAKRPRKERAGGAIHSPKWARRLGSAKNINANFLEAEYEWLYKALTGLAEAELIETVKSSEHNTRDDAVRAARESNAAGVRGRLAKDLDENGYFVREDKETGEQIFSSPLNDEWKGFRQRIAIGLSKIRKALEDGQIENIPKQFRDAEQRLLEPEDSETEFDEGSIFPFLAWIMDTDQASADSAAMVFKSISNRKQWTKDLLGKRYVETTDMESLVKRGFAPEGSVAWQADTGHLLFVSKTIPEHVMDRLLAKLGDLPGSMIPAEDVAAAMASIRPMLAVGGPKYQMILPAEIADTLNSIRDPHAESLILAMLRWPTRQWKRWVLINPRRVLKYNINNFSGDLDAVIAGNPRALKKLPQAVRELYRVTFKGDTPSERFREATEFGVIDSGWSVQELPDINALSQFERLIEPQTIKRPGRLLVSKMTAIWRGLQRYTWFRENWLRYAAYLDYVERHEAGESMSSIGYGAAKREMVDAISDPKMKAAYQARELIGDYGAISAAGQEIRSTIIPFYSWMEINTKRYWRLGINAWSQGVGEGLGVTARASVGAGIRASVLGVRVTVWLHIRAALLYGMVQLWNNLVFGDEEDELRTDDRVRLHLNLGRDASGEIRLLRFQGAMSDYLGWVGFENAAYAIGEVERGRASWGDVMEIIAKAPVNRVINGVTPLITMPFDLTEGLARWPDVFHPRPIRDKWRHVMKLFSVENEYDLIFDRPSRGFFRSIPQAVIAKRNVAEIAYGRVRSLAFEFMRRTRDTEGFSTISTERSRALHTWRLALRFGDASAANRARRELTELGVTGKDLQRSIKRAHPLGGIPIKHRARFLNLLTARESQSLSLANRFYRETYLQ